MSDAITRRTFLGRAAVAGAGVAVGGPMALAQAPPPKATVVRATRANACRDMQPNAVAVKELVNAAVMKLSGRTTPAEAWAHYVKPDDVVGLKINCLFGIGACTHPEVTSAVIEGCKLAGVRPDNIVVWDRTDTDLTKCGYTINREAGVKCLGVNRDWETGPVDIHTCKGRLAKVLTQTCTALINIPILKTHTIAGITAALKNHYGSFHNPWEAHANACDPFCAHLNALPPIRNKTRLIICDALLPVAEGGPRAQPQWTWECNAILAATDPVALDWVGLGILDARREKLGLGSVAKAGAARHVFGAAAMGLGVAEAGRVAVVDA